MTFTYRIQKNIVILFLCIASSFVFGSAPLFADQSVPREVKFSKKLVSKIFKNNKLTDRNITISENDFWELDTELNLPFSRILALALRQAITEKGGTVSLRPIAERPWRLMGAYKTEGPKLRVTLWLREMGESSAVELKTITLTDSLKYYSESWFSPSFDRVSRTLMRLLENRYTGIDKFPVRVQPFRPANPGDPALKVGSELQNYMAQALTASPVFQASACTDTAKPGTLIGTYAQIDSVLRLRVTLHSPSERPLAAADFDVSLSSVPEMLRTPEIQSISDAARYLSDQLSQSVTPNTRFRVQVRSELIVDTRQQAVLPISQMLADAMRHALTQNPRFTLIPPSESRRDGVLRMTLSVMNNALMLTADLCSSARVFASANTAIQRPYWPDKDLLTPDMDGHIAYLMVQLENKEALKSNLPDQRLSLLIHPFSDTSTGKVSSLGSHIAQQAMAFFSCSRIYQPVKNPEKHLAAIRSAATRAIAVTPTVSNESIQASLLNTERFIEGSIQDLGTAGFSIEGRLIRTKDQSILASATQILPRSLVPDSLQQSPDEQTVTFEEPISPSLNNEIQIQLFTQKSGRNPHFFMGEEVIFNIAVNHAAYIRIYDRLPNGDVYRIFPNTHTAGSERLPANVLMTIPNDETFRPGYAFKVTGDPGVEQVRVYAFDKPIEDLPHTPVGEDGMRLVKMTLQEMDQFYRKRAEWYKIRIGQAKMQVVTANRR